jgi:hypothetical protein
MVPENRGRRRMRGRRAMRVRDRLSRITRFEIINVIAYRIRKIGRMHLIEFEPGH